MIPLPELSPIQKAALKAAAAEVFTYDEGSRDVIDSLIETFQESPQELWDRSEILYVLGGLRAQIGKK